MNHVLLENLSRRHLSSQQKAMVAVEAKELYELFEEEAKQAQREYHGNQYDSGLTENFREVQDDLDPETAATIAVEMGDQVKSRQERETAHKVAKTMGTNRDYVRKAKKIQEHAPDHHRD